MSNGFLYINDQNKEDIKSDYPKIKVTDILEGGHEISSDWLQKEVQKVLETRKTTKEKKLK